MSGKTDKDVPGSDAEGPEQGDVTPAARYVVCRLAIKQDCCTIPSPGEAAEAAGAGAENPGVSQGGVTGCAQIPIGFTSGQVAP